MMTSIQGKSTFYIITVLVFFLLILLLFNYLFLRDFSLSNAERTSGIILESADSQFEIIFNEIEAIVSSLSLSRAVREVDVEDMSELFINNVFVRHDIVRAVYLGTRDGRMYEWGIGEGFVDNRPSFPPDYDPRERPWYRQAEEAGGYGLTQPYVYASIEALGVTAARPVYDGREMVGILGLDLILYGLENVVDSLNVPMGGKIILLDRSGDVLVNQFSPRSRKVTDIKAFPYPGYLNHIDGFVIDEVFGSRYMISNRENLATGWTMLLFIPYSRVMEFSLRMIMFIIFLDLLLVFMMGITLTLVTRTLVTTPLESIISHLRLFEEGETATRIPPLKTSEFSMMARLFNRLTDLSEESSSKLEDKVEQRTRAVMKLQKENVRLRVMEEKERIHSDLHDSLGARLTNINISNHVARNAFERGDTEVLSEMFSRIENNIMMGIQDLKEILRAGTEEKHPRKGLNDYIRTHISERLKLKDIRLKADLPGEDDLALLEPDLVYNIEKIIQELASNTMKHSKASEVKISMNIDPQKVLFSYRDNGRGFVLRDAMKNGFGIQGLLNRAERVDGILKIFTKEGQGAKFEFKFRTNQT